METLLSVKELAEKLQVSVSAIYKWIDEKRIEYIDLGAEGKRRCIRFRPDFVERLLKENSHSNELNVRNQQDKNHALLYSK